MCVVVYLASGTVSTLQHSEHWAGWTIQESSTQHSLGGAAATTNSVLSSTFNQSRHLLFPKSIKGESAGGIRVRGDGTRHSNATSFLLQKARVLRRESDDTTDPATDPASRM